MMRWNTLDEIARRRECERHERRRPDPGRRWEDELPTAQRFHRERRDALDLWARFWFCATVVNLTALVLVLILT